MEKRQRVSSGSPSKTGKKAKHLFKHKKTSYFLPQNTLAYNPQVLASLPKNGTSGVYASNATKLNPDLEEDLPYLTPDLTEPAPSNVAKGQVASTKLYDRSMDQHSSDDSFDGVRWQPTTSPNKISRAILSSPLRNTDTTNKSSRATPTADTVVNEVTDSVLYKYGSGMQNTSSQTPKNPDNSQKQMATFEVSPSLMRSKSFDPRSLQSTSVKTPSIQQETSNLNSWMNKFAVSEYKTLPKAPLEPPMPATTETGITKGSPENGKVSLEEDPFSDDDTFLAGLKLNLFSSNEVIRSELKEPKLEKTSTLSDLYQLKADTATASSKANMDLILQLKRDPQQDSDPFSDDLDISIIEKNAFSTQQTQSNHPNTKAELAPENKMSSPGPDFESSDVNLSYSRPDFDRYQIESILESTYPFKKFKRKQLILTVVDAKGSSTRIIVRGDSAELGFRAGDIIHVILTTPATPKLVDNFNNLIIWNPDTLITSTLVADQLFCPRKTVINRRFAFPGVVTIPLIVGTTVHEIFQACFIAEKFTPSFMESLLELETERRILDIYSMGDVLDDVMNKCREHFPYIERWFREYFKRSPTNIPTNRDQQKIKFSVSEVLDVEESIWSPMFGIKGMADVTLKANLEGESATGQFLVPMEIKTSKEYLSHHAQAALYSLLFKDRYNANISSFLLVYTSGEGSTKKHDISIPDLRSLINLRNRISPYIQSGTRQLPDLMRQQKCDNCAIQESCMTINYMTENGNSADSGLNEGVYELLTEHLVNRPDYAEFLNHWDSLLTSEEDFASKFNKDLWVMTSREREEKQGKALSGMIVAEKSEFVDGSSEFIYTFRRNQGDKMSPLDASMIAKYDRVLISDELGHFALAQGFVKHINFEHIIIVTRRKLVLTELKNDRFHRAAVLRQSQIPTQKKEDLKNVIFRIDKDEIFYGMGVARFNILNLFLKEGDSKRRRLVVNLEPPKYAETPIIEVVNPDSQFNSDQLHAFDKVFRTKDYSLILGMPGTGKTTVIAHIIRMLVDSRKTILLSSYTNSAVDNILLKVREFGIDFLRLGNLSRIHPEIRPYIPGSDEKAVRTFEDYIQVYKKPYVVACTCLGMRDLAFNIRENFDYCIVDEASQVSMPLSLGPISRCDKFILVGDHYQLPPLVAHPNADVKKNLSRSLFQILADAHPQSVVELTFQYRMCKEIMLISNALVYSNRLSCGSHKVATQSLIIPHPEAVESFVDIRSHDLVRWLKSVLEPRNKVLFLNHDAMNARERKVGENVTNTVEVELIRQMVEALCACGVDESEIGVMTLYRSQLKLLVQCFKHRPKLEILTADRFQGRDKECIFISFVRSNREKRVGDLLRDWKRVNVAVTRARSKLVVVGSKSTLAEAESIKDFISLSEKKGWIYDLPSSAYHVYQFPKSDSKQFSQELQREPRKFGEKIVSKHPVVKDILSEMNAD